MSIPGSNLLKRAFRLIASQSLTYLAYVSRSKTATGTLVPTYALPVIIKGSIQPVPQSLMQLLGLDMQRSYVTIYVPQAVVSVNRDVSSDKFKFGGSTYQALSITKWINIDGWNAVMAVEIPDA